MKKYLYLYYQLLLFSFKSALSYRVNFFVQLWYGPSYALILLVLLLIAYQKNPQLGTLNPDQGILLYSIYNLIYITSIFLFIGGVRHFVWRGVRLGELDMVLTKPISVQFLTFFSKPELQQIVLLLASLALLIRQIWVLQLPILTINFAFFLLMTILGVAMVYFSISTYAALALFMTRANQVVELFDKFSDSSQYPTSIFPTSISLFLTTIVPIAFFGYVQTLILLNQVSGYYLVAAGLVLGIFVILNRWLWREGLKKYSSASS